MTVVSRASGKMSWQKRGELVTLLDALATQQSEVGQRLAQLRRAHGLSQEAAAHHLGISNRQWQRWESGESEPRASNLARIGEKFNVSVAELVGEGSASQFDRIETRLAHIENQLAQLLSRDGAALEERTAEEAVDYLHRATDVMEQVLGRLGQNVGRKGKEPGRFPSPDQYRRIRRAAG